MTGDGRPRQPPPAWGRYLGAGMSWALVTLVFVFAGRWLDDRWGTRPVLTLVLAFVGAAAGFWSMVRQVSGGADRGEHGE